MKADDLQLNELVQFGEGLLSLHGRRLVLHDLMAFAQFRRDMVANVGAESARRILVRFGYFWGEADAAAMKRIFQWDSPEEWLRAGPRLHTLQGAARTTVQSLAFDPAASSPKFEMVVVWHNSGEAEQHLAQYGQTDHAICWILTGYASGYASFCTDTPIYFVEQLCRAKGDVVCSAVGKDRQSWGDALTPYLGYFQGEDIRVRVEQLSKQLAQGQRELTRQRQQLAALKGARNPLYLEVRSDSFSRLLDLAGRVAPYDSSLLITGESGTGKEVLARHIHRLSPRSAGPFVAINCGALPETLLESELFGHKAGAFTGATGDRVGLFEEANKGVIFLDEIGDVTPALQLKLLRVLQDHEVRRVGENRPRKIDVRVIAATNRNLGEAIEAGQFREDLYYRLAVVELRVPPLRQRTDDLLSLARYFVTQFARKLKKPKLRLDATCLDYLLRYAWPGNVRELENAMERAAVLCPEQAILPEHLPSHITMASAGGASGPAGEGPQGRASRENPAMRSLAIAESEHIRAVLELTNNNRTRAARILGISHTTLWRKLKE
jgi:DNA-binding NtrC family response regulator